MQTEVQEEMGVADCHVILGPSWDAAQGSAGLLPNFSKAMPGKGTESLLTKNHFPKETGCGSNRQGFREE